MNCKSCRVEMEESEKVHALSDSASLHLVSCLNCRAFREEQMALKQMIDSLEVVSAPADFDFRLRARLATMRSDGHGQFSWGRFAPGAWSVAIAAALVVIFAIVLMIRRSGHTPSVSSGRQEVVTTNPDNAGRSSIPPGKNETTVGTPRSLVRTADSGSRAATVANVPRRAPRNNANGKNEVGRNPNPDEEIRSVEFASTPPANSVLPPGIPDPLNSPGSIVAFHVAASTRPTSITLDDGRAGPQTISIRPVTFGGQEMFEQEGTVKLHAPTLQGIW